MIELLHELKTAVLNIEAFRHFTMSQEGKKRTKFFGHLQGRSQDFSKGGAEVMEVKAL